MARFRRTRRQVLGHRLYLGLLAAAGIAITLGLVLLVRRIGGEHDPARYAAAGLAASLAPVLLATGAGAFGGRRRGVDADDTGLRLNPACPDGYWPWPRIVDIRAQRRGRRTVIAVDL